MSNDVYGLVVAARRMVEYARRIDPADDAGMREMDVAREFLESALQPFGLLGTTPEGTAIIVVGHADRPYYRWWCYRHSEPYARGLPTTLGSARYYLAQHLKRAHGERWDNRKGPR